MAAIAPAAEQLRQGVIGPTGARDTIFALSSGALPAAIAVVRVSGPAAADAVRALAGKLPRPRRAVRASLHHDGVMLDQAMLLWMPGPGTATGEDVAEFHVHGGRTVVRAMMEALTQRPGCRLAEPGEFTRRALENGRIDLAEAEGLADLLEAETETQRRNALRLVQGGLGRLIEGWRDVLLDLAAQVEGAIDFDEEIEGSGGIDRTLLTRLLGEIEEALSRPPAERLRDGVRVVIAGPVNVGKSSLLNALAGRDAALATDVPGTTRDLIEVPVVMDGTAYLLIDSAGLRAAQDEVERQGIDRARQAIVQADIVLWLGDDSDRPTGDEVVIRVHSRCDLPERRAMPSCADVAVSSFTGEGMIALRRILADKAGALLPTPDALAINSRHRALLAHVRVALQRAAGEPQLELVGEDLREARVTLDWVVGHAGVEDMLNNLFARFCVGK